jgi:RNA polymerase sigma-70 factor, ECF subfamily
VEWPFQVFIVDPHDLTQDFALSTEDAELVLESLQGDRSAYGRLVRKHQDAAFGLGLSYVRDRDDAADLVQDAFVQAYLKLDSLRDPAAFGSWLRSILVNVARQSLRRRQNVVVEHLNPDATTPDLGRQAAERHSERESQAGVWGGISELPEIYRTPIILHHISGLPYEQIADFLAVPVSTVRGRLQKGRTKLRETIEKGTIMATVDVSEKVEEMICRIAREEITAEIDPGESGHLFLSLDVPTEVRIVGHQGNNVIITGHKTAVGTSQEQAEDVLHSIEFRHDEVEDWIEAGQHEGEKFCGTNKIGSGKLVANIRKSGGRVTIFDGTRVEWGLVGYLDDYFPHLMPTRELLTRMREIVPRSALRASLVYRHVTDLTIPQSLMSDELREGFSSNAHVDGRVHGQTGKASLEISVPEGMSVTLGGRTMGDSSVRKIGGNVLALRCPIEAIEGVKGDVGLLYASAKRVRNCGGDLVSFYHDRWDGGRWLDGKRLRTEPSPMSIKNVIGHIELDVGNVDVELREPSGSVAVKNRTGKTELTGRRLPGDKQCRIENRAGDIVLKVSEEVLRERHIAASALSGEMDYRILSELLDSVRTANNPQMMLISNQPVRDSRDPDINDLEADIFAVAEYGDIRFELLK